MSKRRDGNGIADGGKRRPGHGNTDVGYGRPPKEHQFKPGQSGNPKGRPKGAKNEANIFQKIINMKVAMRVGGKPRNVPYLQAMWTRVADDALKGNPKAIGLVVSRLRLLEGTAADSSPAAQGDREILEAYFEERLRRRGGGS